MKIEVEIDDDKISGILCTAFEGGSNYWYTILRYEYAPGLTAADFREGGKMQGQQYWHPCQLVPLAEGCAVVIGVIGDKDGDDEKEHRLDRTALQKGIAIMREKHPKHFADWLSENDDADTGDCFLQCCLFGELVYG
jgi:hypothetical protein